MKMIKFLNIVFLFLLISACKKDPVEMPKLPVPNVKTGFYILNEGNFLSGNASLSYFDEETNQVSNQIFVSKNGFPLGDVAQSMIIHNDKAFIVVNNSGKIVVMDVKTGLFIAEIKGLKSPRYIHVVNEQKAFVSDLYDENLFVINLTSYTIEKTISLSSGTNKKNFPEQMVSHEKYLFVSCWSFNNLVLVVDMELEKVIDSINVNIQPYAMVKDKHNYIWVLTDGGYAGNPLGHIAPALHKINALTRKLELTMPFTFGDFSPGDLALNQTKDTLYFLNKHVYFLPVTATALPNSYFISGDNKMFYALNVNPYNNTIVVADAIDFQQQGAVRIYQPSALLLQEFKVGINPGFFCFMLNGI
jgi:hypothetical protein